MSQARLKSVPCVPEPSRPEQVIAHLLKNLHHAVRQTVDEAFRAQKMDMSVAHFVVLLNLDQEPGLAGAELARRGFVTAQSMNTILRRLERDGDIERRPHPQKARADSWFVTKTGQARLARARVIGGNIWVRMLSALQPTEIKQLQGLLERCIGGLDVQLNGVRVTKTAQPGKAQKKTPTSIGRRR
ncbi:MAG: MarR family transcriptional regulator [Steroidobacteraceae bacterium]